MNFRTLELNLAQLGRCIQKSRFNKYSDKRKGNYQKALTNVFEKLLGENFSAYSSKELVVKKSVLDFVFESIEYLDNSTLTVIPFEIVYCLENALNEWIPANNFIVVTSLSNSLLSYSVTYTLALDPTIYTLLQNDYKQTFDHKLVQITLPRYYVHDYLANVVLYHELGHFIDIQYRISETIVYNEMAKGKVAYGSDEMTILIYHYMEYFADLFAAQYVGNASNVFLDYIAHKHPDSDTHPATDSRIALVKDFLNGNFTSPFIKNLRDTTLAKTGKELEVRYDVLATDEFNNLLPYNLSNSRQLHSIFLAGWNAWQEMPNKLSNKFGNDVAYKAINNLIEKSISNYIVVENWNK